MKEKTEPCVGIQVDEHFDVPVKEYCPNCTKATERMAVLEQENKRLRKVPDWFEKKMEELEGLIEGPKVAPTYRADARLQRLQMKQMELLLNAGDLERDLTSMRTLAGELAEALEPLNVRCSDREESKPDDYGVEVALTVGEIKRARVALAKAK